MPQYFFVFSQCPALFKLLPGRWTKKIYHMPIFLSYQLHHDGYVLQYSMMNLIGLKYSQSDGLLLIGVLNSQGSIV